MEIFNKLTALECVMRWNFHPTVKRQSVLEHSAAVGIIAGVLASRVGLSPDQVAVAGLLHDFAEAATGDIPFLVKRAMDKSAVHALEDRAEVESADCDPWLFSGMRAHRSPGRVRDIVKLADYLDSLRYAMREQDLGNRTFDGIVAETNGLISTIMVREPVLSEAVIGLFGADFICNLGFQLPVPDALSHL